MYGNMNLRRDTPEVSHPRNQATQWQRDSEATRDTVKRGSTARWGRDRDVDRVGEDGQRSRCPRRARQDCEGAWVVRQGAGGLSLWLRLPAPVAEPFVHVALPHVVDHSPPAPVVQRGPDELCEGVDRLEAAWQIFTAGGSPNSR